MSRKRALSLTSATGLVVGSIIGTGVVIMPAVLAAAGLSSLLVLAVIAAGAMLLAVLFGQLTKRVPSSDGGLYAYVGTNSVTSPATSPAGATGFRPGGPRCWAPGQRHRVPGRVRRGDGPSPATRAGQHRGEWHGRHEQLSRQAAARPLFPCAQRPSRLAVSRVRLHQAPRTGSACPRAAWPACRLRPPLRQRRRPSA